ncbi:PIN domain-containing protein [Tolypothrix sp. VBCCA 56010]|uniref:PIN domain-containing protein n=1 Tax=Tolypothrix sp. VBCCA 56010 TaxID=3137731 RepID=UPI003D7E160E
MLKVQSQAIAFNFRDFEDAVQYACAIAHGLDVIVTRDVSGECKWGNSRSVTWAVREYFKLTSQITILQALYI